MSRRSLWPLVIVPVVLFASVNAQQPVPSGEELYIDRLGCWNCHGKTGGGGAGPSISKSQLPLREFVKAVRLPRETMPRVSAALASDVDLAVVYHWLDGREALATPPPVSLVMKTTTEVTADGLAPSGTEVELTARTSETSAGLSLSSLRYRVLLAQAKAPVPNRTIQYRLASSDAWSAFTTDERGEAMLGSERGFVPADVKGGEAKPLTTRLRMALSPGRYALVVEALQDAQSVDPTVVGLGTAILIVE